MKRPPAITLADLVDVARRSTKWADTLEWLRDRKSRRAIPHRLEDVGYEPVRNDAAQDGLWKIDGKRQVVYAKRELSLRDRLLEARKLCQ